MPKPNADKNEAAAKGSRTRVQKAAQELAEAMRQYETSHPMIVKAVNEICRELSGLGI